MFISEITGEIRTASEGGEEWVVQDDGHGFPCFYNPNTDETVFDDPRFLDDESADMEKQKEFVLQEMRYAAYFCKEYWEKYSTAKDKKVIHLLLIYPFTKIEHKEYLFLLFVLFELFVFFSSVLWL
jgi:hypothetical protein